MDDITITKDTPLQEIERIGAACDRCGRCCSFGSGFILEKEIPAVAKAFNLDEKSFKDKYLEHTEIFNTKIFKFRSRKTAGKPYGPCIFLENNLCKINNIKPLHCRIGNCAEHGDDLHTWFIVNNCLNVFDPESIRQYHSYIATGGRVLPGAELERLFPDKKQLKQILEYERMK